MDYEKKYKEALERARQFSEYPLQEDSDNIVEYIFPELKESKNESVREALITYFKHFPYDSIEAAGTNAKKAIAWLEKQGEQTSAWSEEDERICRAIICDIANDKSICKFEISKSICDEQINWLKSLKDRIGG